MRFFNVHFEEFGSGGAARAEFRDTDYAEPYVIVVAFDGEGDPPWHVTDSGDADPIPCATWAQARAAFAQTVAEHLLDWIAGCPLGDAAGEG